MKEFTMIVNVSEAKTNLSKLIDMVYHGQEVIIAKNNLPIVDLVLHTPKGKRKLGLCKDQIVMTDDFYNADDEIAEMFYGTEE